LRNWIEKHKDELFANDAVGTGCFSYLPGEVVWAVTRRCNLKCKHCSIAGEDPEELTTEEGFGIIEEAAKLGHVKFAFTGGEPLLRDDIYDLIEYASSFDMQVVMATNGTLITKEVAEKLKKAGLERAAMSIDGIGNVHDELRGVNGAFEDVLRGMKACGDVGLATQLFTMVTRDNYSELPKIITLADDLSLWRIYLIYLIAVGRGKAISEACLSTAENMRFFDYVADKQKEVKVWLKPICNPQEI
jgi:MoaA/NifB/PqqE/SkfB family radical SAM enzyme